MSTPERAIISFLSFAVDSTMPSVSRPASSNSVFAPRILMAIVLKAVPTTSGFCTTVFAAVINAILSSSVAFAAINDDAERSIASPIPPEEIAKLLPTSLNLSTILMANSLSLMPSISFLKADIVEIRLSVAPSTPLISSPTTAYIFATSARP